MIPHPNEMHANLISGRQVGTRRETDFVPLSQKCGDFWVALSEPERKADDLVDC